jgi:hypothetical protein
VVIVEIVSLLNEPTIRDSGKAMIPRSVYNRTYIKHFGVGISAENHEKLMSSRDINHDPLNTRPNDS